MKNIALLIGNSEYRHLSPLKCCIEDIEAVSKLIHASKKFDEVVTANNLKANELRTKISEINMKKEPINELFFFYSGHGWVHQNDFYFCAADFDNKAPNNSGLPIDELYEFFRSNSPNLVVSVIDACHSGVQLIKGSPLPSVPSPKGINDYIGINSSRSSQSSFTGEPMSVFTAQFYSAVLEATNNPIRYRDIKNSISDAFIKNPDQTPIFTGQFTEQEIFADDVDFFKELKEQESNETSLNNKVEISDDTEITDIVGYLKRNQSKFATKESAENFVGSFFEALVKKYKEELFIKEIFDLKFNEYAQIVNNQIKNYMVDVLANEKRIDGFFIARKSIIQQINNALAQFEIFKKQEYEYTLEQKCEMTKIQLIITFTPKILSVKRYVLVLTCVPSLDQCFIFESLIEQSLLNWNAFDRKGDVLYKRCFKSNWDEEYNSIISEIYIKFKMTVEAQIEETLNVVEMNSN